MVFPSFRVFGALSLLRFLILPFSGSLGRQILPEESSLRKPGGASIISVRNSSLERGGLPQELYHSRGCSSGELQLRCPSGTLILENATYTPGGQPCHSEGSREEGHARLDLRTVLNRRCSGLQACSLDLPLDHPESLDWPSGGRLDAYYRCAEGALSPPPCGEPLPVTQRGFLASGSYPKYYSGSCKLLLRAQPGQRLSLRFLDVHLRLGLGGDCLDYLLISERGRVLRKLCGELRREVRILSDSHELDVQIHTSGRSIQPRRGFLAEYWPVGCLQGPVDSSSSSSSSFISFTNATHMTYSCPRGMAFAPEKKASKTIHCNGFEWSEELYTCQRILESFDSSSGIRSGLKLALLVLLAILLGLLSILVLFLLIKTGKTSSSSSSSSHALRSGGPIVNTLYTEDEPSGRCGPGNPVNSTPSTTTNRGISSEFQRSELLFSSSPHPGNPCVNSCSNSSGDISSNSSDSLRLHEGLDLCRLQKEELYLC